MAQKYRNFEQTVNMRLFLIDNSVWAMTLSAGFAGGECNLKMYGDRICELDMLFQQWYFGGGKTTFLLSRNAFFCTRWASEWSYGRI
jgi:hypothetical protein